MERDVTYFYTTVAQLVKFAVYHRKKAFQLYWRFKTLIYAVCMKVQTSTVNNNNQ